MKFLNSKAEFKFWEFMLWSIAIFAYGIFFGVVVPK